MYGKPVEDEIHRIKKGNRETGEFMLSVEELSNLIENAKNGDDAAKEKIWSCHLLFLTKRLAATTVYVGDDRCKLTPDEALSLTWESLLKALESYNGSSSFSYWYWRKVVMDLRSEWRRRYKENDRRPLLSDIFNEDEIESMDMEDDPECTWLDR